MQKILFFVELKRQMWWICKKWANFYLSEEVDYRFDELKIKYGTKPGDMLLGSLFSTTLKKN
jgi:hypothetical protein